MSWKKVIKSNRLLWALLSPLAGIRLQILIHRRKKLAYSNVEKLIRQMYKKAFGKYPDLENPVTYNEKIQWLKVHWYDPLAEQCADKYAVRSYIEEKVGKGYLPELHGIWDRIEDIDFDKLPDKFVLKSTHASGHVIICRDKSKLNRRKVCRTMAGWLKMDFFAFGGEWVYRNIPRRIICEELIKGPTISSTGCPTGQLPIDYKIFCFHGIPKLIFITSDRAEGNLKIDFYDCEWKWQPIRYHHYPNKGDVHVRPEGLDKMLSLARTLSSPFPHVRVDFYVEGERILVGELTFFTMCGLTPFEPEEYDGIIGNWLSILPLRAEKAVIA
jgi:hypothetical protein